MEYTPGPWGAKSTRSPLADTGDYETLTYVMAGKREVCYCPEIGEDEEEVSNAKLIASAPDMLEALKCAKDICAFYGEKGTGYKKIINAIKKATE